MSIDLLQSPGCGSIGCSGGGGGGGAMLAANAAYDLISAEIGSVTVAAGTTIAANGSLGAVKLATALAAASEITICDGVVGR